jgi:hypothetical protein
MATTSISDIVTPEVLGDQVSAKFPDRMVLANTNLVEINSEFPLGVPGTRFKMPFWKRIGAFAPLTEGTAMTPGKIQAIAENATVQRAGSAFAVDDMSELVSKADPVSEIADQIARRAAEFIDAALVGQLELTPNVFDQTGTSKTNANMTMDQNTIIQAMLSLGDNYGALVNGGRLIMHSKVFGDLIQLGAIQNQYQSGMDVLKTGMMPTLLGLPIEISDLVTTVNVSGTLNYHTYMVGVGSLALIYQRQVMTEFDRDILLQNDIVASTCHFAPHLYGYDDVTTAVVYEQNKSIHVVRINSK